MTTMPVSRSLMKVQSVAVFFAYRLNGDFPLNKTRIMKLVYLAELRAIESWGRRLTSAVWRNWYYGPYSEEVSTGLRESSPELKMELRRTPSGREGKFYIPTRPEVGLDLSVEEYDLLNEVARYWKYIDNEALVEAAKTSPPFIWTEEGEEIPFDQYQSFIERYKEAHSPNYGRDGSVLASEEEIEAFIDALGG